MKVDFHNVALGDNLHTWHLSLGQHLIDKVIPRDVTTTGINGVQQAHDERYDEEGPQTLPVHLVLLLATFLLLWEVRQIVEEDNEKDKRKKLRSQPDLVRLMNQLISQAAKATYHLPSSSSGVFPFGPSLLFFSCLDWDVLKKFSAPESKVFFIISSYK